jgi:hypothetical protein
MALGVDRIGEGAGLDIDRHAHRVCGRGQLELGKGSQFSLEATSWTRESLTRQSLRSPRKKAALYRRNTGGIRGQQNASSACIWPDEVLADAHWPGGTPTLEEVQAALAQLTAWASCKRNPTQHASTRSRIFIESDCSI